MAPDGNLSLKSSLYTTVGGSVNAQGTTYIYIIPFSQAIPILQIAITDVLIHTHKDTHEVNLL